MRLTSKISTHRVVLRNLIKRYEIGTVPQALNAGDPWLPPDKVAELNEVVDEELVDQGLLSRGELRPDFEDALVTVARPEVALYAWSEHRELGRYKLWLGRNGRDAAILDVAGDKASLWSAEHDRLPMSFAQELPAHVDGVGRSYTFPEAEAPWNAPSGYLPDGSRARPDARAAAAVIDAERIGVTQVHAAGARGKVAPVTVVDFAERGRWTVRTDGRGTDRFVTIAPATVAGLVETFARMIAAAE